MDKIVRRAVVDALGTIAYIIFVVSFIFSLRNFPKMENTVFIPIAMLLLFVCSAAITGFLVFGKPAMLYIDGKKREAISLIIYTLCILLIFTVIVFIFLLAYFSYI